MKKSILIVFAALMAVLSVVPVLGQDATLVIWLDDSRSEAIEALGEAFEAENGVAIETVVLPFGDIRDNLKTAAPAGEGPDILIGAHDWLGELAVNGLLAEIDLGEKADLFVPAALQAFSYEGVQYGMPYATENVAFIRNSELVPDAPTTWEEVRAISEELVANGDSQYGYIIQENDPYHFFGLQTAFGGYVFGLTDEGYDANDVGIDSEGTIAAAQWLESYVGAGLMPSGLDYDTMHALFESGDAAMIVTGPWAIERITESGIPFEISAIPGEGSPFLGVQGFMINAFSENTLLANLFLTEYVATDEAMQAIFDAGDRPSAFISVLEASNDPVIAAYGAAGTNGLAMPAIPAMSAVWSSWGNAMELVIQGQQDAEEAFTDAATQIREAISEEG